MKSLISPAAMYLKAILFVVAGFAAASLLIVRQATFVTGALLVVTVWAFCRAYYFACYVLERYVDPTYRFSGRLSFVRYVWTRRR